MRSPVSPATCSSGRCSIAVWTSPRSSESWRSSPSAASRFVARRRERSGIRGDEVRRRDHGAHVSPARPGHSHGRSFRAIRELIRESALKPRVCELALQVFVKLAEAEGKVHGVEPDDVEFHEVGAVDAIVDIVGAAWAIDALGIERADRLCTAARQRDRAKRARSAAGPGTGDGRAAARLSRAVGDGAGELVTPTGAAIVAALARPGAMPETPVRRARRLRRRRSRARRSAESPARAAR